MKRTVTLIIRTFVLLMLVFECNNIDATNPCDSLHLPYFIKDGNVYSLHSSVSKPCIERELSDYIEQELPIVRYDCSFFRLFIQMTINKSGKVKRLKLLNSKSFKDNMVVWKDVKAIIQNIKFYPATRGKSVDYTLIFCVNLKFY